MNAMNYDRKILKDRAKASLRGIQPRPWKATLVYLLIVSLLPMVVSLWDQMSGMGEYFTRLIRLAESGALERMDTTDGLELLSLYWGIGSSSFVVVGGLSLFFSILLSLIQVVLGYGYKNYSLKLYRGEQTAVRDVFSGLNVTGRAICTAIMVHILTFLWGLLALVLFICAVVILVVAAIALSTEVASVVLLLLLIPLYIALIAFILWVTYRYSLAPYFILTTDMGTMDAIRESKNAMQGNIGRRFVLDLSFIGWDLLVALIVGIVVAVGTCMTIFAVSFGLALSGSVHYINSVETVAIMTRIMGGVCVSAVIATLVALPLTLWLTAYRGSAEAGFFLTVTGLDEVPQTPTDFPPRSSADSVWDSVPTAPGFTTPPTIPPAPPAPPQPPVTEAPPPAPPGPGPNDPIPAAPEPPVEVVPETSAAPEEPPAPPAEEASETPAEPSEEEN